MGPHFAFITIHVSLPVSPPQPRNRESFKIKVGKMSSLTLIPCPGLVLVLNRVIMEIIFADCTQIFTFLEVEREQKTINLQQRKPQNSYLNPPGGIRLVCLCLFILVSEIPQTCSRSQEKISRNEVNE